MGSKTKKPKRGNKPGLILLRLPLSIGLALLTLFSLVFFVFSFALNLSQPNTKTWIASVGTVTSHEILDTSILSKLRLETTDHKAVYVEYEVDDQVFNSILGIFPQGLSDHLFKVQAQLPAIGESVEILYNPQQVDQIILADSSARPSLHPLNVMIIILVNFFIASFYYEPTASVRRRERKRGWDKFLDAVSFIILGISFFIVLLFNSNLALLFLWPLMLLGLLFLMYFEKKITPRLDLNIARQRARFISLFSISFIFISFFFYSDAPLINSRSRELIMASQLAGQEVYNSISLFNYRIIHFFYGNSWLKWLLLVFLLFVTILGTYDFFHLSKKYIFKKVTSKTLDFSKKDL